MHMRSLHMVAVPLVIAGAINWGLVGLFDYNLVNALVGSYMQLEQLVYILVGLSGLYLAFTHYEYCKECSMMMKPMKKGKK